MLRFNPGLRIQRHWSGFNLLAIFSVLFTGCASTCFVAVSKPPNGTIGIVAGNPAPACPLAKAMGAVRVVAHVNHSCDSCSESNRIQSVLLNLTGFDIHLRENVVDESSGWQELLPELKKQARQVQLLNESTNSRLGDPIVENMLIPAGTYDLVRFRIAPNLMGVNGEVQAGNACAGLAAGCVVMVDGQIVPLLLGAETLEFRFTSETTVDGLFLVLPDSDSELFIKLTPIASTGASLAKGMQLFSLLPNGTRVARLSPVD